MLNSFHKMLMFIVHGRKIYEDLDNTLSLLWSIVCRTKTHRQHAMKCVNSGNRKWCGWNTLYFVERKVYFQLWIYRWTKSSFYPQWGLEEDWATSIESKESCVKMGHFMGLWSNVQMHNISWLFLEYTMIHYSSFSHLV